MFDRDFPNTRCADVNHVVRIEDEVARFGGQSRIGDDRPKRHMRVEQQPHLAAPANRRATVSLSRSIVSGTKNLPLATPIRGPRPAGLPMGTNFAAGLPLRAITISCSTPLSTASTRRERLDLASSIL